MCSPRGPLVGDQHTSSNVEESELGKGSAEPGALTLRGDVNGVGELLACSMWRLTLRSPELLMASWRVIRIPSKVIDVTWAEGLADGGLLLDAVGFIYNPNAE